MKLKTEKKIETNVAMSWFFVKLIDKYDWKISSKTDRRRERTQIISIMNETGDITTELADIKKKKMLWTLNTYIRKLRWNGWFPWETHPPQLIQHGTDNLNSPLHF